MQWHEPAICTYVPVSLVAPQVKNPPVMQETPMWFLGWEDPLEEGMEAHSNTLAWRIPWTEEAGGLQSMGSQRVGHNWATEHMYAAAAAKSLQSCPTLCDPIDGSPPGSARTLEWVVILYIYTYIHICIYVCVCICIYIPFLLDLPLTTHPVSSLYCIAGFN